MNFIFNRSKLAVPNDDTAIQTLKRVIPSVYKVVM